MNDKRHMKKEKYQQIQVFVRVRPINNAEQKNKSINVVEVPNDKEVIIHECPHEKFTKKFKFDNVFGPSSKQIDVYNVVVNPLLEQVLAGYNCTVFAYGQTGTGKTFTMEGINSDPTVHWQSDSSAGMIPRSLSHLFDKLQLLEAQEYTIRVSFLELYNEDLFDLLAPSDDTSKIRLYEDSSKKGAVIIHGLAEMTIHNKNEVFRILEKGAEKRQTAATLMNTQSSRSHTVFSITIHVKENTIDGEEVLKTGKLNLVDLAGSENVGKSGAVDRRAREAGSINQSLLTLGRVITALVERAPHIPYRESKLTRLLQESLGGRTKTSIIATISPESINVEETLSTLDYAHRAKNITNRPEINQKLSKREFLKQYTEEIERLQRDLLATRERNGVYIADENYSEMQTLISQQAKEIEDKINHIKALEKTMEDKEKIYNELELQNAAQMKELYESKIRLNSAADALNSTKDRLKSITQERDEQKHLVKEYVHTEQSLLNQAQILLTVADTATADSYKLHDKIEHKNQIEREFETLEAEFKNNMCECLHQIQEDVLLYTKNLQQFGLSVKNNFDAQFSTKYEGIDTLIAEIFTNLSNLNDTTNLTEYMDKSYSDYQNWIKNKIQNTINVTNSENELLNDISTKMVESIENMIENEVAKNLRIVRNKVSERLEQTSTVLKEIIDSAYSYQLQTYNNINKNVDDIIRDIEILCKKQELSHKQHLFTKMMTDVYSQFNTLNESQKEHHSTINKECDYISKICNEVHSHATKGYNTSVAMNNNLKEQVGSSIEEIKNNVTLETELNEDLAIKSTAEGRTLINKLKSNINDSCNIMKQYRSSVESNVEEVQSNINMDRNEVHLLIDDAHQALFDIGKTHAEFMQDKRINICEDSERVSANFDDQITKSCACSEDIAQNLRKTVNEINEFFENDIQRDIPTGSTPAKKQFSYPRQFKVTSPHERLLQRFRETRRAVESVENDDTSDISSEMLMKQMGNSTTLFDTTLIPSQLDNTMVASVLNTDFTSKYKSFCNSIIESDMEDM